MFCPSCGKSVADGARFCPHCGANLPILGSRGVIASQAAPTTEDSSAGGSSVSGQGTPTALPAGASAHPTKRRGRTAVIALAALLVVAGGAFALTRLLPSGGSKLPGLAQLLPDTSEADHKMLMDSVASDGTYDYFISKYYGGICRLAAGASSAELIYPLTLDVWGSAPDYETGDPNRNPRTCDGISVDGDWLYASLEYLGDFDEDEPGALDGHADVLRMRTDGSDASVVYSLPKGSLDDDDIESDLSYMAANDGKLYVIARTSYEMYSPATREYQLIRMDSDGQNQENLALVKDDEWLSFVITSDRLYYTAGEYSTDEDNPTPTNQLYSENLDGTDFKNVYTSKSGSISDPRRYKGRLYLSESYNDGELSRVISMAEDGSDVQEVFVPDEDTYDVSTRIVSIRDDVLYLMYEGDGGGEFRYDSETGEKVDAKLIGVPLDGSGSMDDQYYNSEDLSSIGRLFEAELPESIVPHDTGNCFFIEYYSYSLDNPVTLSYDGELTKLE